MRKRYLRGKLTPEYSAQKKNRIQPAMAVQGEQTSKPRAESATESAIFQTPADLASWHRWNVVHLKLHGRWQQFVMEIVANLRRSQNDFRCVTS